MKGLLINPFSKTVRELILPETEKKIQISLATIFDSRSYKERQGLADSDIFIVNPECLFHDRGAFMYRNKTLFFGKVVILGHNTNNNFFCPPEISAGELEQNIVYLSTREICTIPAVERSAIYAGLVNSVERYPIRKLTDGR